jgi:hypothetical protein
MTPQLAASGHRMRAAILRIAFAVLLAAAAVAGSAAAQTLNNLPKSVADEVRAAEAKCRTVQGEPIYEVPILVRAYYMGQAGIGRETFVISFDEFECVLPSGRETGLTENNDIIARDPALGELGSDNKADLFCDDDACRLVVFLPSQRNRWVKAYDDMVISWLPYRRDGKTDGPNVRLRMVVRGSQCGKQPTCERVLRAAGDKLVQDR